MMLQSHKKEEKYHIRNDFGMIFFTNSENKKILKFFRILNIILMISEI